MHKGLGITTRDILNVSLAGRGAKAKERGGGARKGENVTVSSI